LSKFFHVFFFIYKNHEYIFDKNFHFAGSATNTSDPISAPVTRQEKKPYIQMRFSLSDEYSNVVTSEASFINSIKQGLSLQTGYSIGSFKEMQVERGNFNLS
jgi:hypothetical protein